MLIFLNAFNEHLTKTIKKIKKKNQVHNEGNVYSLSTFSVCLPVEKRRKNVF